MGRWDKTLNNRNIIVIQKRGQEKGPILEKRALNNYLSMEKEGSLSFRLIYKILYTEQWISGTSNCQVTEMSN